MSLGPPPPLPHVRGSKAARREMCDDAMTADTLVKYLSFKHGDFFTCVVTYNAQTAATSAHSLPLKIILPCELYIIYVYFPHPGDR